MKRLLSVVLAGAMLALTFGLISSTERPVDDAEAGVVGICGPMDVVFSMDTTGSMGGAIGNVIAAAPALLAQIALASGGDANLGLVTFKDDVTVDEDLAAGNAAAIAAAIAGLFAAGGAGGPEASDESVNTVVNGLDSADRAPGQQTGDFNGVFRAGAVKILILITDAPPGGFDDTYTAGVDDVAAALRATEAAGADIKISSVYVPTGGIDPTTSAIMTNYATATGGSYTETAADGTGTAAALSDIISNCGSAGCTESPIAPSLVEATIFPGGSTEVTKCVEIPDIPPKLDICLVQDETGSMADDIASFNAVVIPLIVALNLSGSDYATCVGGFRDFAQNGWGDPGDWVYRPITGVAPGGGPLFFGAGALTAGGGNDGPEAQLEALHYIADGAHACIDSNGNASCLDANDTAAGLQPAWRAGSERIVLLATDADCHVTGDAGGWPGDAGTASAAATAAALNAANITVIGLVPDGGSIACVDALAAATGGSVKDTGDSGADIASAILAALAEVTVDVSMVSNCAAATGGVITTTFDPASQTVPSGGTATFTETITVSGAAPGGIYVCQDFVLINGSPLLKADGSIAAETKVIKVPEGFLTGGGQLKTGNGKGEKRLSWGGNVGFLADFSVVGQWQLNLHNVGVDSLDKTKFHSTSFQLLQFFDDGGIGPNPPPANANVGVFLATGRLDQEDGWHVLVCVADRGEPGRLNDSLRVILLNPSFVAVYDSAGDFSADESSLGGVCNARHKINAGNIQIHSGLKN